VVEWREEGGKVLHKYFEELTDKRQGWKIKHNLLEIVVVAICAVMTGIDSWWQIADFAKVKLDWLRQRLGLRLEKGAPSHDTFRRVFELINPREFEKCFVDWVRATVQITEGEVVSIDGKTLRGSRKGDNPPIHLVGAWASKSRVILGQTKTGSKSNEITAIPDLLEMLDLKGCIVTIDAMGAQTKIAEKIAEHNDYVLAVKENREKLYKDILFYFEEALQDKALYFSENNLKTAEKAHGRIEIRRYYLETDIDWLRQNHSFSSLNAIGAVEASIERNGKATFERRYYITTLTDVKTFANAVRSHWGIENSLHYCLDVTFNEDRLTHRVDNAPENFSVVRRIVLNLAKNYDPDPASKEKISVRAKLKKCEYDPAFLSDLLASALL